MIRAERVRREVLLADLDAIPREGGLWGPFPDDDVDARDARAEQVRTAVASALTERQREVVEMHYFEGLSQGEIALRLGVSQQVVHKALHGVQRRGKPIGGALRRLREVLADVGCAP